MRYKLTHEESYELNTFLKEVGDDLQKDEKVTMRQAYTLRLKGGLSLTLTRKRKKAHPPPPVDIFIAMDDEHEKIKDISPDNIDETLKPYFENPSGASVQYSPSFDGSRSALKSAPRRKPSEPLVEEDDDDDEDDEDDAGGDHQALTFTSGLNSSSPKGRAKSRTPTSAQARSIKNSPARSTRGSVSAELVDRTGAVDDDDDDEPRIELSTALATILQRLDEATDNKNKQKRKYDELCQKNPKKTNFEISMLFAEEVKKMELSSDAQVKIFEDMIAEIDKLKDAYYAARIHLVKAIHRARVALDDAGL